MSVLKLPAARRADRKCGACTLCCTALAVPELDKKTGERCVHLTAASGCGIYEARPESCRAFECGWLHGVGDISTRPDRVGAVIGGTGEFSLALYVVPGDERWRRSRYLRRMIDRAVAHGDAVVVVTGEERKVFAKPGGAFMKRLAALTQGAELSADELAPTEDA